MGLVAKALTPTVSKVSIPAGVMGGGRAGSGAGGFTSFARQGYQGNEIVFTAIDIRASSAAEPKVMGRRWKPGRNGPQVARAMALAKFPSHLIQASMLAQGYVEELPNHPLVKLLNRPNPFMSRTDMFSTFIMDRDLGGNAYWLKARASLGNVAELWRLRPDRVTVVPSKTGGYIDGYEYRVGNDKVFFPHEDVIHWKTRHPLDDYYGMPPLMAVGKWLDIGNYMGEFLRSFYERGGTGPGAVLSTKGQIKPEDKKEIGDRLRRMFSGPSGWFETLILDNAEGTTYSQMGLDRGLRDALPKELNEMVESKLAMPFGIPGSILGLLIGYESSSYANKKADWQVLWDITLAPLWTDIDEILNLTLTPEFGGIDEIFHDMSDVKALQEDVDKLQDRARANFREGVWSREEARALTGVSPDPVDGTFYIPSNMMPVGPDGLPLVMPSAGGGGGESGPEEPKKALSLTAAIREGRGRPTRAEDGSAREAWADAQRVRRDYPSMTNEQVASRVGVSVRTLQRYERDFGL